MLEQTLSSGLTQMAGLNGRTLIGYASMLNDLPTIKVLMNDYKQNLKGFLHNNDQAYIAENYKPSFKEVIDNCFRVPARFH